MSEIIKLVHKNFRTVTINMFLDLKENTSKMKKEMEPVGKKVIRTSRNKKYEMINSLSMLTIK